MKFEAPKKMRYVDQISPGGPDVLTLNSGPLPEPKGHEVLIEVHAAGVNRSDLAQRSGKYPPPLGASPLLGLEVAGVIVATGPEATLKVGDRVCALTPGGGYAEYCLTQDSHCLPIPSEMSMTDAAGLPETFFTVWANVFQIGELQKGERFLVHGGSSGIGTTAIQMARAFGAKVFATAGSEEKCENCRRLGAQEAINYKSQDFESEILRLTSGHGVHLILDMVGGDYTEKNINCLAHQGRLVQIAVLHGAEAKINLAKIMQKRLTLTGSTLRPRSIEDKALIASALEEKVWPLIADKKIKAIVDRVFPIEEVRQAHEYLEAGKHFGKVILKLK